MTRRQRYLDALRRAVLGDGPATWPTSRVTVSVVPVGARLAFGRHETTAHLAALVLLPVFALWTFANVAGRCLPLSRPQPVSHEVPQ
ncbi:hypothetical protein SAMN04488095_2740 [Jannaschia pohangensis]|uniref:Uncharacterized protein n=1 Tax=Jannaschia pohangensis TaxID=390807 RepID=A0A1I3R3F4_9RHOB|nr:hypothetical protein SAMN04488095_2740 [Jannaschia pohangensis]